MGHRSRERERDREKGKKRTRHEVSSESERQSSSRSPSREKRRHKKLKSEKHTERKSKKSRSSSTSSSASTHSDYEHKKSDTRSKDRKVKSKKKKTKHKKAKTPPPSSSPSSRSASESDVEKTDSEQESRKIKRKKDSKDKDRDRKKRKRKASKVETESNDSSPDSLPSSDVEIKKKKKETKSKTSSPERGGFINSEKDILQPGDGDRIITKARFDKLMELLQSSNERLKILEDEKAKQAESAQKANTMLTPPPDIHTPQHLKPKSLFTTPKSTPKSSSRNTSSAGTPQTPSVDISDIDSVTSEQTSGTTPDMSKLSIGRGRGRPRKQLVKPTYDDFPIDGTDEEQKRYIKKKRTEIWRFNKLTSSDSSEYRQSELQRVKDYQKKKKDNEASPSDDSRDSSSEHKRKLSRQSSDQVDENNQKTKPVKAKPKRKATAATNSGKLGGIKLPSVQKAVKEKTYGAAKGRGKGRGGHSSSVRGRGTGRTTRGTLKEIKEKIASNKKEEEAEEPLSSDPVIIDEDEADDVSSDEQYVKKEKENEPQPQRTKQTARRGMPFNRSNPSRKLTLCVDIKGNDTKQIENDENKMEKDKEDDTESDESEEEEKKIVKQQEAAKTEADEHKGDETKEDESKDAENKNEGGEDIAEGHAKEGYKAMTMIGYVNNSEIAKKDDESEQPESQKDTPLVNDTETEQPESKIDTTLVLESEEDKEHRMSVIGQSLTISKLEDELDHELKTHFDITDSEERIRRLKQVLGMLQNYDVKPKKEESVNGKRSDKKDEKPVNSEEDQNQVNSQDTYVKKGDDIEEGNNSEDEKPVKSEEDQNQVNNQDTYVKKSDDIEEGNKSEEEKPVKSEEDQNQVNNQDTYVKKSDDIEEGNKSEEEKKEDVKKEMDRNEETKTTNTEEEEKEKETVITGEKIPKNVRFAGLSDNDDDFHIEVNIGEVVNKVILMTTDTEPEEEKHKIDNFYVNFPSSQSHATDIIEKLQEEDDREKRYAPKTEDITDDEGEKYFQKDEEPTRSEVETVPVEVGIITEEIRKNEPERLEEKKEVESEKQEEITSKREDIAEDGTQGNVTDKEDADDKQEKHNLEEQEEIRKNESESLEEKKEVQSEKQEEITFKKEVIPQDRTQGNVTHEEDANDKKEKEKLEKEEEIRKNKPENMQEKTEEIKAKKEEIIQDGTEENKDKHKIEEKEEGEIKNEESSDEKETDDVESIDSENHEIRKKAEEGLIYVESGSDFEDNLAEKWKTLKPGTTLKSGFVVGKYYLVRSGGNLLPGRVKGDNYRRTKEGEQGNYTFEVGFDLFTRNPKGGHYKQLDEWWLIEMSDICHELKEPTVVKVTTKRSNYVWESID